MATCVALVMIINTLIGTGFKTFCVIEAFFTVIKTDIKRVIAGRYTTVE